MEGIESGAVSIVVCGRYDAWRRAYTWFSVQSNQPFKIKENLFETIQVVCAAAHFFFSLFFSLFALHKMDQLFILNIRHSTP